MTNTKRIESLESKIVNLEKRLFEIEQPPKYELLEKIGYIYGRRSYIIIDRKASNFGTISYLWYYDIMNRKTKNISKMIPEHRLNKCWL